MISIKVVFIISFLLIFTFIYKDNKKEPVEKRGNLFLVIVTAFLLALAPTVVFALFLFVILGSSSVVNMLFSLHISTKLLILLSVFLLIYLFTVDSIIEIILKHILGKNMFYMIILLLIRMLAFYAIGLAIGVKQPSSFKIAIGVSLIIFVLEILYGMNEKNK